MTENSASEYRARTMASVLRSPNFTDKESLELRLLYYNPQGLLYRIDDCNRPQSKAVSACKTSDSKIKKALGVTAGDGMSWVGRSQPRQKLWQMNDAFRSAADSIGYFGVVSHDELATALDVFEDKVEQSLKDTSTARLARIAAANPTPQKIQVTTYVFERNQDVAAETLVRANGKCQRCGKAAPFLRKRDQQPYLEVHHVVQLANSGEDTLENAIATCPNCHRELHLG